MKNRRIISWNMLLCIGALSFFSATGHATPKPVLHKATARIMVFDPDSCLDPFKPDSLSSGNPYFLRTQIEIIQSKSILHEVVKRLDLAESWSVDGTKLPQDAAHEILIGSLKVYQQRDTTRIAISVQRFDLSEAAKIANTIAETFRDSRLEMSRKKHQAARAIMEKTLEDQKARVDAAEKKIGRLRNELGVPADNATGETIRLQRLEDARNSGLIAMIKIKAKLQILKDHAEEDSMERASFACFDQMVLNSVQQIQEIKIQITLLETEQGDEHPELKLSRLRKQKLEKTVAARLEVLEKILKSEYTLAEKMFKALNAELDGLQSEAISRHKKEKPYRNALTKLESEQIVFDQLKVMVEAKLIAMKDPKSPVEIISLAK